MNSRGSLGSSRPLRSRPPLWLSPASYHWQKLTRILRLRVTLILPHFDTSRPTPCVSRYISYLRILTYYWFRPYWLSLLLSLFNLQKVDSSCALTINPLFSLIYRLYSFPGLQMGVVPGRCGHPRRHCQVIWMYCLMALVTIFSNTNNNIFSNAIASVNMVFSVIFHIS